MLYKNILLLILISITSSYCFGQLETGENPVSFTIFSKSMRSNINPLQLPEVDNETISKKVELEQSKCTSCRNDIYGEKKHFRINFLKNANKTNHSEGVIYTLQVNSSNAYGMQFLFDDFYIPVGGKLHFYTPDRLYVYGAFTNANNHSTGTFTSRILPGKSIVVEYFQPNYSPLPNLTIADFVHVYRDLSRSTNNPGFGESGSCTVNVDCDDRYQRVKKAVAMRAYINDGTNLAGFCTGSLIAQDINNKSSMKPYFITAEHCWSEKSDYDTYTDDLFYFEYESEDCNNPFLDPIFSGPSPLRGARLRSLGDSFRSNTDYVLMELEHDPKIFFDVAYLGWDSRNFEYNYVMNVSHPQGDIKKGAFSTRPTTTLTELDQSNFHCKSGLELTVYEVKWDEGVTQPGSSGSPLINSEGQLIGVQHGGFSRCADSPEDRRSSKCTGLGFLNGPDHFSKLSHFWERPFLFQFPDRALPSVASLLRPNYTNSEMIPLYDPPSPDVDVIGGGGRACDKNFINGGLSINKDDGERSTINCIDSDLVLSPVVTTACPNPRWTLDGHGDSWACDAVPADLDTNLCDESRLFGRCKCTFLDYRLTLAEVDDKGFLLTGLSAHKYYRQQVEENSGNTVHLREIPITLTQLNDIIPLQSGKYYRLTLRTRSGSNVFNTPFRTFQYIESEPIALSGFISQNETTQNNITLTNARIDNRVVLTAKNKVVIKGNTVIKAGLFVSDQGLCDETVGNSAAPVEEIPLARNIRVLPVGQQELHGPPMEEELQEAIKIQMNVFPNPSNNGVFQIQCSNGDEVCEVLVYDMNGRMISNQILQGNLLDISKERRGIYFIKVITEYEQLNTKLIYQ